jgi:hypothetical protein
MVYPHFSEEGYEVLYSSTHRWFFKRGMSTNEVVIFNLDDTLTTAAKCKSSRCKLILNVSVLTLCLLVTPHAAFMDPSASGGSKRASIEARAIIIG